MTPRVTVYKGSTFNLAARWLDTAGAPRPLAGVVVTAWMGTDAFALPVGTLATNAVLGDYVFNALPAAVATWPVGVWALYAQYEIAGVVTKELACLLDVQEAR